MIRDNKAEGEIIGKAGTPHSYIVQTPSGSFRRNRRNLSELFNNQLKQTDSTVESPVKDSQSFSLEQATKPGVPSLVTNKIRTKCEGTSEIGFVIFKIASSKC